MNEELETLIEAQRRGFPGDTSDLTPMEAEWVKHYRDYIDATYACHDAVFSGALTLERIHRCDS